MQPTKGSTPQRRPQRRRLPVADGHLCPCLGTSRQASRARSAGRALTLPLDARSARRPFVPRLKGSPRPHL
jgi:hypothetical protein